MRDWKYIMVRVGDDLYPVLFPQEFVHKHMAEAMRHVVWQNDDLRGKDSIVSAGFVSGLIIKSAGGESESLGLKSAPDDAAIIMNDMLRHLEPNAPLMKAEREPVPEPPREYGGPRIGSGGKYGSKLSDRFRDKRLRDRNK